MKWSCCFNDIPKGSKVESLKINDENYTIPDKSAYEVISYLRNYIFEKVVLTFWGGILFQKW